MPDNEAGRLMAHALKAGYGARIVESDDSLQLASVDEQMKHTLDCLKRENTLHHKYDYIWIMRYINEEHLKSIKLFFCSVNSYRNYLVRLLGMQQVAALSTLSQYYNCGDGHFPEWTFSDTKDATERLRRVNVARRFAAVFIRGFQP